MEKSSMKNKSQVKKSPSSNIEDYFKNLNHQMNNFPKHTLLANHLDKRQILRHQKFGLSMQCAPQTALKALVCSLKNALSDIESQCLADYEHLSAQNIPLTEGIPYPNPFDILSSLKAMLDAYIESYTFHQSPRIRTRIRNRI